MKKNSRLICLLVAVLLATTMLSGVASAKDQEDAIKGNLYVMPTEFKSLNDVFTAQIGLAFNVFLYQDNLGQELGPTGTTTNDYYDDKITLNYFPDPGYTASSEYSDKNIADIEYFITQTIGGQPVIVDPEFVTIESSDAKVIKVNATTTTNPYDPKDKTKYIEAKNAKGNAVTLEYMSEDNMIDWLYNGVARDATKGMKPGKAKITIKAYAKDIDKDGKDYLAVIGTRSFDINVNVVKWNDVTFIPNTTEYLKYDADFNKYPAPFVTAIKNKDGVDEYYLYMNELERMAETVSWMTKDKGLTFPMRVLGDFHVDPDLATYQVGLYDLEDTNVANLHNNEKSITIKTTGDFGLIITDKDGYSNFKKVFKFHVLESRDAVDEIIKLRFVTPVYDGRNVGDIIDLDTYAIVTRKIKDKETDLRLDVDFAWDSDYFVNEGKFVRSGINSTRERFTVEYKSSNPEVAKVFNKSALYTYPNFHQTLIWDPKTNQVDVGGTSGHSGTRYSIWSNQDLQYVYPHEGTVLIENPGEATITCTITNQNGKSVSDSVIIRVNGDIPQDPVLNGVTADEEIKLYTGNTAVLGYAYTPANATGVKVTFASSNDSIALVDKAGKVTAGKDGECEITTTVTDGKNTFEAKTKVIVIGNASPVVVVEKNGLTRDTDNKFRYYEKNELKKITGIVWFDGAEFWVVDGELAQDATGLTFCPDKKFYFLESGRILRVTQGASYDDEFFFVSNGELDTKKNGLCDYDGAKFLIAEGHFIKYNGLWLNPEDSKWYFLADGQWKADHKGVVEYDHRFFVVKDGILDTSYNDTIEYDGHTFVVRNGQLEVTPLK